MKKFNLFNLIFIPIYFLIASCAMPQHQALKRIDVGMDKSDVLDIAGNPTRTGRMHGQDRWTYETTGPDGLATTYVYLHGGKVTYIGGDIEGNMPAPVKQTNGDATKKDGFKPIGEK